MKTTMWQSGEKTLVRVVVLVECMAAYGVKLMVTVVLEGAYSRSVGRSLVQLEALDFASILV